MKKSGALVASLMAASSVAFNSTGDHPVAVSIPSKEVSSSANEAGSSSSLRTPDEKEKFAPKFDGLRFIETLVTAHR